MAPVILAQIRGLGRSAQSPEPAAHPGLCGVHRRLAPSLFGFTVCIGGLNNFRWAHLLKNCCRNSVRQKAISGFFLPRVGISQERLGVFMFLKAEIQQRIVIPAHSCEQISMARSIWAWLRRLVSSAWARIVRVNRRRWPVKLQRVFINTTRTIFSFLFRLSGRDKYPMRGKSFIAPARASCNSGVVQA